MAMSLKERDVVLIGTDNDGKKTFDLPITRLGNIEDGSEIKERPAAGDYIPIMDSADNGQMKKTPYIPVSEQSFEFEESKDLTPLSSGGKSGTLFGKLAKAVNELISHLKDDVKHITSDERTDWNGKAAGNHSHSAVTQSTAGFMIANDKKKLDGIDTNANNYAHPTTAGNKHIPAGGKSGQILRWSSDGTAIWGDDNDTVYTHPAHTARTGVPAANQTPAFGGTFSVSQPVSDASGHVTAINEKTVKIPNSVASNVKSGLMSADDKIRLDNIPDDVFNLRVTKGTIQVGYGFFGTETVTIPHNVDMFIAYRGGTTIDGFTLAPADGVSCSSNEPITVKNNDDSTATLTLNMRVSASSAYTFTYYAFKFI